MAPTRGGRSQRRWAKYLSLMYLKDLVYNLMTDPNNIWIVGSLIFIAEIVVNLAVIHKVSYTEIDWEAYMSEVEGFINGTRDYEKLEGGTGPLVYPAGFVYIFSGLYYLTDHGKSIRTAQYIFLALYLATIAVVFYIYQKTKKAPPYILLFMCCLSYRIHSIYVLRLFNDPVAMLLFYVSLALFINDRWTIGCFFFSIAVGVKMNILLFAPGLLLLLLIRFGLVGTIGNLFVCGSLQVLMGLPFLLDNPVGYLNRSFNIGRQFFFKWTVNWRFLSETFFQNRIFHLCLLLCHVFCLLLFVIKKFPRPSGGWYALLRPNFIRMQPSAVTVTSVLFASNFIGMTFCRSLHYQFYVWYFHTLHHLLWCCSLQPVPRLLLLGVIEMCWNTYPSTSFSSIALHLCHLIMLAELYFTADFDKAVTNTSASSEPVGDGELETSQVKEKHS